MTEPPAAMEEEFNAWYNQEHLPERLSIPGFRSARRWVSAKTYLATYELDSAAVLNSREYLSFYLKPTPWTRRCLDRCVVFKRWACAQVEPGEADPHPMAAGLVLAENSISVHGTLQVRRFAAESGEKIVLYEVSSDQQSGVRVYRLYQP